MSDAVIQCAIEAGAVAAAFAQCGPIEPRFADIYDDWLARGANAGMDYMEQYRDIRNDPRLLLEGARSMLCCAFPYGQSAEDRCELFSDYAVGDDYHEVLRRRLEPVATLMQQIVPGSNTRICIDTAPLRERYWAMRAGVGFIGINNQLIVPGIGSKVFLAEILWTAEAEYGSPVANGCAHCGRCVKACPGGALDGNGGINCRMCLSYLTIEHRGELPDNLTLPHRIYGCDICQDVCPHNSHSVEPLAEFRPRPSVKALTRSKIIELTQTEFSSTFTHSAVKRAKLAGLQRNARCPKER